MAHNQFSALTYQEFSKHYLGATVQDNSDESTSDIDDETSQSTTVTVTSHQNRARKNTPIVTAPTPKNWTETGDVTSVKNQGQCGSCWAFAALAAIESSYLVASDTTYDLSEQQMVDCVYSRDGCGGGWMSTTYNFIINNDGVKTEDQ